MMQRPTEIPELQAALARATKARQPIGPIDVRGLNRLLEHSPADLTCTVECGLTLANLQKALSQHAQWLPINPPHPHALTLRDVIDGNLTGPRRLGFGSVREYLIGLEVLLADGTRIRSGGRVVKNVAGYDLHKLFVGSGGSLGIPVTATFKLLPLPETTVALRATCHSVRHAVDLAARAQQSLIGMAALDVLQQEPHAAMCSVVLELTGARQDVAAQRPLAASLGFREEIPSGWDDFLWPEGSRPPALQTVLPSRLSEALAPLSDRRFIARAANGIIYHDGPRREMPRRASEFLEERTKEAFDPFHILPAIPS